MATSTSSQAPVTPRLHRFELVEGMQLQINVSGSCKGRNVKLEFQLSKCTSAWILHWGCVFRGNMNWYIPNSGSHTFKQGSLQTPLDHQATRKAQIASKFPGDSRSQRSMQDLKRKIWQNHSH